MKPGILITGGAGYIGSHLVKQLLLAKEHVVVLDNLSTGFADNINPAQLIVGDIGDTALVETLLREHCIDTVIHLAAYTEVAESVTAPLKYYENNTVKTDVLVQTCLANEVHNLIFSSSAAVYAAPETGTVTEASLLAPANPYGISKLFAEWRLRELALQQADFRYAILRYFNVAGAAIDGSLGPRVAKGSNLIKVVVETLAGKREVVPIYGTDYATPDGTCIRDYIHVEDIVSAHLNALYYLRQGQHSVTLNCGYGRGYSVKEVIAMAEQVARKRLPICVMPRRTGDPPVIVANIDKIKAMTPWQPRYDDLALIIQTALAWEQRLAVPSLT